MPARKEPVAWVEPLAKPITSSSDLAMSIVELISSKVKGEPVEYHPSCDLASYDGFREDLNPSYRLFEAMKLPDSEGSVFLVPLRNGGYARGVVARASSAGKVLLGYFFGPRLLSPNPVEVEDLDPTHAVLKVRSGDLGLMNGAWPIIGKIPHWDRTRWLVPLFVRKDPFILRKSFSAARKRRAGLRGRRLPGRRPACRTAPSAGSRAAN
jgi:hypothetical protein